MIIPLTAIADSDYSRYSFQLINGQGNPWAIPVKPEDNSGFQQYQNGGMNRQNYGHSSQDRSHQRDRFVTPEFLESLKRQQSQQQIMPENWRYHEFRSRSPKSYLPGSDYPGYPSYGIDNLDPLYETPVLTPWSPWDIGTSVW